MAKRFERILIFSLAMIISLLAVSGTANADSYTDASSKIRIIKQYQNKYKELTVPGTKDTVYHGGCGLFSIAHAIQWLTNTKISESEEYSLIKRLVDMGLETQNDMTDSLKTLCKYDSRIKYHQGELNKSKLTEEKVKSIFDNGGVIIANPVGHYVLAVGYRYYKNMLYIQIVDSSTYSTIEPRNGKNLHIGYKYNSMEAITGNEITGPSQYWVSWACFSGNCSHERYFRDWWWLSSNNSNYHEISGNTGGSTVFYVNSTASDAYIYLKSEKGTAYVNQHNALGIHSGYGNENHHGFYLVSVASLTSQYQSDVIWAPSATKNTSNVSMNDQLKISFPSSGAYYVEVEPLSNSAAAKYWKVDSIQKWINPATWYYTDTKSNCIVTKNKVTIDFSLSSGGNGVPSGQLPKGKSYELRGVVNASENIKSITATIYDSRTGNAVSGIGTNPITINPNSKSVDIYSSKINTSLKFSGLPDGSYRYELVVTTVSGWTQTVAKSSFIIGNSGGVKGDANGNGKVEFYDIVLLVNYYLETEDNISIVFSNCDIDGDGKIKLWDVIQVMIIYESI